VVLLVVSSRQAFQPKLLRRYVINVFVNFDRRELYNFRITNLAAVRKSEVTYGEFDVGKIFRPSNGNYYSGLLLNVTGTGHAV
jgi:hypothetical protein